MYMYYVISILLGLIPEVLFIVLFLTSAKQLKEKRIRLFFIISIFYFLFPEKKLNHDQE